MDKKRRNKSIALFSGAIFILLVGIFIVMNSVEPTESQVSEQTKQIEKEASFRNYDELTVKISEYELYNRNPFFYSKEEAAFHSLSSTIGNYALFHYLKQHDYEWDKETRALNEKIARSEYEYLKTIPVMQQYYDKMFEELEINEAQYIEYYLYPQIEYEKKHYVMFEKAIGLQDGGYPTSESFDAYSHLVGVSESYLNELAEKIPAYEPPLEQQPNLGFSNVKSEYSEQYFHVKLNEQGDYIFAEIPISIVFMDEFSLILRTAKTNLASQELTRATFDAYKQEINQFEAVGDELFQRKKELQAIFEVLETTIQSM